MRALPTAAIVLAAAAAGCEWTRDDRNERFTLQARDSVCWTCHAGAEQSDYVWIYELGFAR